MSVSSVPSASAPLPFNYLDTNTPGTAASTAAPDASPNDDAGATQEPAPPPLPPGQGTRVNQLV